MRVIYKSIYEQIAEAVHEASREGKVIHCFMLTRAERHQLYKTLSGKVASVFGVPIVNEDEDLN